MGDRCYCTLTITGVVGSEQDWTTLMTAISEAEPEGRVTIQPPKPGESGTNEFSFSEVNYATMDDNLQTALTSLGLAYSWINGQGDDYGNGCVVSDGMGGHYEEALTGDHDLYLILTEAQDADRLAYLQHLDALMETIAKGDLLYAPSAHAQLAAFANDPQKLQAWKDRVAVHKMSQ